ncbi:MAG: 50S ribosomal protein L11 methyltransferase [Verrucomicrobiales bacterium]
MHLAITEIAGRKTVRVEAYCERKADAERIQKQFGGSIRALKRENWAAMAPAPSAPIKVRGSLLITQESDPAAWEKLAAAHPGREIISIPPEMAFGTGDHATTASCLRFLCDCAAAAPDGWAMLDLGCGSGILALAAVKLGAASALGIDYDPQAVRVARENAKRNGVPPRRAKFAEADVLAWDAPQPFDLVAANLFSSILEEAFPRIVAAAKPGAPIVISGILREQADGVFRAGEKAGFELEKSVRKGKWVAARGRRRAR